MKTPILKLTNGTDSISLIDLVNGIALVSWRQAVAQYKGGGTFRQSSLSDGRRLVDKRFDNAQENLTIKIGADGGGDQNQSIAVLHALFALLEGASDYWAHDWVETKVWLESRASCETNTRYALVVKSNLAELADIYSTLFNNGAMDEMSLEIEHEHWLDVPPGTGTAVPISAVETFDGRNLGNVSSAGVRTPATSSVYVANKRNVANLTDIYTWSAANGFSANLMDAALPFDLIDDIGVAPAINDYIAFGIDTTIADSGPFVSLVLDIGTAQTGHSLTWEYWNGAWVALSTKDNTATAQPFDTAGINSVHWQPPIAWATVAVNAITGYWVRARITAIPGPLITPTQQNRDIYSIVWPYVEIQASEIAGNLSALARMQLTVQSQDDGGAATLDDLYFNRVLVGLRSISRGSLFTSCLNAADEQNPAGLTVTTDALTTIAVNVEAPAGRSAAFLTVGAEPLADRVIFTFDTTLSPHFYGTFRVFGRFLTATFDAISTQLRVQYGSGGESKTLPESISWANDSWLVADYGKIDIPPPGVLSSADAITLTMAVQIQTTGAAAAVLYDLVLIPADEWIVDTNDVVNDADSTIEEGRLLDIDSIINPKTPIRSLARDATTAEATGIYLAKKNGPATLRNNDLQRLWYFAMRTDAPGSSRYLAESAIAMTLEIEKQQRYLGPRGAA